MCIRIRLCLCVLLAAGFISVWQMGYAETIFIFNPEARVSEVGKVKKRFADYLEAKDIHSDIYVFARPADFQISVDRLNPDFAVIASYYYASMKSRFSWNAVLSGHYRGKKEFRKVLVTFKSVSDPVQLKGKSLAAVSLSTSIDSQLSAGLTTQMFRLVSVSKDIDAIMALGFKQVQAAIVTDGSFKKMKVINPDVAENLHILQKLPPTPYPMVAVFPNAAADPFVSALKDMRYKGPTKQVLRFFGITGFTE
ncbi:PhnD/SsuA/transferrin family substrate-binding protein [Desulfobacterales bacterium HSG2]|nr:PhnD/SsuA/transferrin family substrate-binding protein [Desulfobacterales bacterium HSG2]